MTAQQRHRFEFLLLAYMAGTASPGQRQELSALLEAMPDDAPLYELMEEIFAAQEPMDSYDEQAWQPVIDELISRHKVRRMAFWKKIAVAASVVLAVGIGTYFLFMHQRGSQQVIVKIPSATSEDVSPGTYKAQLVLADGRVVILDSAMDGQVAQQGRMVVVNADGKLVYQAGTGDPAGGLIYNTLATGKGETYATVLSDGTRVWLNAASSIKFPVAFTGDERSVEITGEAYFEVARDPKKPFHVNVNGMDVQVLGTHFNINSYTDEEAIKTTLLEGSIKVTVGGKIQMIKPGQQAQVTENDLQMVSNADVDRVMAWKNGYFSFDDADIQTVMRQLSRWYNIEVVFRGAIPKQRFNGEIGRSLTLKDVLEGLAFTSQHFKIENGSRLIILP